MKITNCKDEYPDCEDCPLLLGCEEDDSFMARTIVKLQKYRDIIVQRETTPKEDKELLEVIAELHQWMAKKDMEAQN